MAVAVYNSQRREERDPLDTIAKALNIASAIYGIKDAGTKAEALRAQVELAKQKGAREDQTQALDVEAKKLALRGQGAVEITDQNGNVSYEMPKKVSQTFLTTPDRGSVTKGLSDEQIGGSDENPAGLRVPESAYVDQYGFAKPGMFGNQKKTLDQQKEEAGIEKTKAETDYILGGKGRDQDKASAEASAKLRHERSTSPVTKATQELAVAYNKILAAHENPSAAGDVSLIYSYIKMLDPGSAVKEGEIALAEQAKGVPSAILNMYNKAITGQRLPQETRQDFVNQSGLLYKAQEQQQKQFDANLARIAQKSGVDPSDVIIPFGLAERPAAQEKRLTEKKPGFFDSLLGSQSATANRTEISPEDARLELIRRKGIGKVPK